MKKKINYKANRLQSDHRLKKVELKIVIACPYFGCFILCLDYFTSISTLRQVAQRPISTNPKLNFNQSFFIPLIQ